MCCFYYFCKYYFYWLFFYNLSICMMENFYFVAMFSHVVVLIPRELHVQICSVEACNRISITHYKVFCGNHNYKMAKCFLCIRCLYFSTVRCDLAKATRSWYPGPSCQWVDCLHLHCPVANMLQLLPHTLIFRFWIILVYSWNTYNLSPKRWLIWGIWKSL